MLEIKFSKKERSKKEFSKKAIISMTFLWFFGALFAFFVVAYQLFRGDMTVALSDLLLYIGAPMTGGIVSYMIKSATENKEKIKGENTYEYH